MTAESGAPDRVDGYAAALLDAARGEGLVDRVVDELFHFARAYEGNDALRIVIAMGLVLAAKGVTLALPFAYKGAVDAMSGTANEGVTVALALVAAYALGRFTSVAFDNLRNIAFERVGQVATLHLAEDVFHRLHRLSLLANS